MVFLSSILAFVKRFRVSLSPVPVAPAILNVDWELLGYSFHVDWFECSDGRVAVLSPRRPIGLPSIGDLQHPVP